MMRWPQHAARVLYWFIGIVACNTAAPSPPNATQKSNTTMHLETAPAHVGHKVGTALPQGTAVPQGNCWQGGYTAEVCCKANPVVNCWDSVFTFGRCCTGHANAGDATVTMTTSVGVTAPVTTTVTTVTSMSTVAINNRDPPLVASDAAASVASAAEIAVPSLVGARGAMATQTVSGDPSCWQDGFTYKRCCEVPPIVAAIAGCWDPVFTERRCCGTRIPPVAAPAAAETRRRPAAVDSAETSAQVSSSVSAPVAAILSALTSPKAWGEKLAHTSPERDNTLRAVEVSAEAAREKKAPPTEKRTTVPEKDSTNTGPVGMLAPTQATMDNAELALTGGSRSESENSFDEYDDGSQAAFFRREGSRRFAAYFEKANRLLNKVLSADDPATEGSTDGWRTDAVQIYHMLYETVNQLVGGMQLAFEATGQNDEKRAPDPGSSAAMKAAFLSAAMLLARLAQASKGTPLEHEDFSAQATAAIVLSCPSRDNPEAFRREMSRRIAWLEQRDSEKTSGKSSTETPPWRAELLANLRDRINTSLGVDSIGAMFERSWQMYSEDLVEAVWRPANGRLNEDMLNAARSTLNPTEEGHSMPGNVGHMWQIFPSFLMTKSLLDLFSRAKNRSDEVGIEKTPEGSCPACEELTRIVLDKYAEFEEAMRDHRGNDSTEFPRPDEINNAFFAWQLTHESEQEDVMGQEQWPELYRESRDFQELRYHLKLACLEYLQQVYDPQLSEMDLAQLDLTLWASVTPAAAGRSATSMNMPFHDHPLALLSGVFYAQAGGANIASRTPTVFADPRGTTAFRYTRQASRRKKNRDEEVMQDTPEPTAPFHRLAYSHASDGKMVVFPSWLVHGVPPHRGEKARVVFAFNLHTLQGTTLSSWAKTAL